LAAYPIEIAQALALLSLWYQEEDSKQARIQGPNVEIKRYKDLTRIGIQADNSQQQQPTAFTSVHPGSTLEALPSAHEQPVLATFKPVSTFRRHTCSGNANSVNVRESTVL
jgi:hypothetical protein